MPLHEPGRYFAGIVVPSAVLPQRHAATEPPAVGAVKLLELDDGASEMTPVASPPTFCTVTVMTPAVLTATADTYLVWLPDAALTSQPQVEGSEPPEAVDCTTSVTVVRQAEAAKMASEMRALRV